MSPPSSTGVGDTARPPPRQCPPSSTPPTAPPAHDPQPDGDERPTNTAPGDQQLEAQGDSMPILTKLRAVPRKRKWIAACVGLTVLSAAAVVWAHPKHGQHQQPGGWCSKTPTRCERQPPVVVRSRPCP
ncbi:hypothetical protein F0L68_04610 [Solihabitans fulvus]|uniref:Uncharacterized protein n=1 Tax=Solihabitans fulvus TaxID=1892852 RepID=A0A5B2XQW8_9PSEU|nr:hypothetical protein F0L68_04610 [Solihabitans fulvus]